MAVVLYIANENGDKEHQGVKYFEGRFPVKRMKNAINGGYVCNLDELLPEAQDDAEPSTPDIDYNIPDPAPEVADKNEIVEPVNSEVSSVESTDPTTDSPNESQTSTNEDASMSNEEIRKAAHKAGVKGWDTKRVETLRKELNKAA